MCRPITHALLPTVRFRASFSGLRALLARLSARADLGVRFCRRAFRAPRSAVIGPCPGTMLPSRVIPARLPLTRKARIQQAFLRSESLGVRAALVAATCEFGVPAHRLTTVADEHEPAPGRQLEIGDPSRRPLFVCACFPCALGFIPIRPSIRTRKLAVRIPLLGRVPNSRAVWGACLRYAASHFHAP